MFPHIVPHQSFAVKTQVIAAEGFEMDEAPVAEAEVEVVEIAEDVVSDDAAAATDE